MTHSYTVTVEIYNVCHNPGNKSHMTAMLESYLRGKGIQTKQEYRDGRPLHNVVINTSTVDNVKTHPNH
jgi:hypothetical protein